MPIETNAYFAYLVRQADTALVLGHRLSEWLGKAPTIEEELALTNIGLDLIGQARALYVHALAAAADPRDEDQLVFLRDAHEYRNFLLVEKPNGDFAFTIARQLVYSTFAASYWEALTASSDAEVAGIASKAMKESAYHVRHAGEWLVRLGDGTDESHRRSQDALDEVWMYTGEMFEMDTIDRDIHDAGLGVDKSNLRDRWNARIDSYLAAATLVRPKDRWMATGGATGRHTEHLGPLLAQMQFLQRAYPGQKW